MTPSVFRSVALVALATGLGAARAPALASAPTAPMFVRQGSVLDVPAGSPLRAGLQVVAVGASTAASELVLPASVEADPSRSVNIVAPLSGRVTSLGVRLGDTVRRGQLLAAISAPDLTQAVADLARARDAIDLAQRALARAQGVNQTGANATKDVEAAQSAVVQQAAELARAESRLNLLGVKSGDVKSGDGRTVGGKTVDAKAVDPAAGDRTSGDRTSGARASGARTSGDRTSGDTKSGAAGTVGQTGTSLTLTAPFDGTVISLQVAPGAYLNDTTAPLMTIANLDRVWVTVGVPENALAQVVAGQPATVTLAAYPGRRFVGRIAFINPVLDTDTRRARARIAFVNTDHALKPNLFASAALGIKGPAEPEVPASALLMNNDRVSVFVEVRPWTFERRVVELGREDGERVRITRGLRVGERVVARGGVLLND